MAISIQDEDVKAERERVAAMKDAGSCSSHAVVIKNLFKVMVVCKRVSTGISAVKMMPIRRRNLDQFAGVSEHILVLSPSFLQSSQASCSWN